MKCPWFCVCLVVLLFNVPLFGQIAGTVKLEGKAPERMAIDMSGMPACAAMHPDPPLDETVITDEKNNLQNVVVFIQRETGQKLPAGEPAKKPVAILDQKGCQFVPHILAIQTGQAMKVTNDDDMAHNVQSLSIDNDAFSFSQASKDPQGKSVGPFKVFEEFKVHCNVHPWMLAWMVVIDHPYFAMTGADGKYKIDGKDLPDGKYTLTAWHEKYQTTTAKIDVKGGKTEKPVDLSFKSDEALKNMIPPLHLASRR